MKPNWYTITNNGESTDIMLYGVIGRGWDDTGNDPKDFIEQLDKIPRDQQINLHIHSPGGSVFDGLAIYNRLAERREYVHSIVDGVALSAASWIAMAGKTVEMPRNARMMVHDAQGFAIGDSKEMREIADLLDRESDNIADIYAQKTGKSREEMRDMMRATTWMNGEEAKLAGFADIITDSPAATNTFDLSRFKTSAKEGGLPAATVNQGHNMQDNKAPVPAGPEAPDLSNKVIELENALTKERAGRIKLELANIARTRPTINVAEWEPKVVADPDLINTLKSIPESGQEAIRLPIENKGNPVIERWNALKPGRERRDWMVNQSNFEGLNKAHREFMPANSNTLSLTMPRVLEDSVITIINNKLAMLDAFTTAFSPDPGAPRRSVIVPYVTAGANTVTNGTNFETGDATVAEVEVTISHYSKPYHMDNNALNQGWKLAQLADINANGMANQISDLVTAVMVVGTYGAGTAIGAAASFDAADLPAILALASDYTSKNLILDSGHYAYLAPLDRTNFNLGERGAYGFDKLVENNRWTSATTNTCGFVCSPTALVVASGLPFPLPSQEYMTQGVVSLVNGLSVATCSWFSRATRLHWASYDICFGAKAGDTTAAEILLTS